MSAAHEGWPLTPTLRARVAARGVDPDTVACDDAACWCYEDARPLPMTAERTPDAVPYTPTTEQVRNNMAFGAACGAVARQVPDAALVDAMRDIDWPTPGLRPKAKAQFDAWLAAHDAEVLTVQREGLTERVAEVLHREVARAQHNASAGWDIELVARAVVAEIYIDGGLLRVGTPNKASVNLGERP